MGVKKKNLKMKWGKIMQKVSSVIFSVNLNKQFKLMYGEIT